MTADPSSRHAGLATYRRAVGDLGEVELLVPRLPGTPATSGHHRVVAGERLDLLAARFLDDPYAWWRFADADPTVAVDALDRAGHELRLPERGT